MSFNPTAERPCNIKPVAIFPKVQARVPDSKHSRSSEVIATTVTSCDPRNKIGAGKMAARLRHAKSEMHHVQHSVVDVIWPEQAKPKLNSWIQLKHGHSALVFRKDKWQIFEEKYAHGRSTLRCCMLQKDSSLSLYIISLVPTAAAAWPANPCPTPFLDRPPADPHIFAEKFTAIAAEHNSVREQAIGAPRKLTQEEKIRLSAPKGEVLDMSCGAEETDEMRYDEEDKFGVA